MTARKKTMLYWAIGIATAFSGVAIARWLSPHYNGRTAAYLSAGGQLMALMGLVVIAFGVRQRVWVKGAEGEQPRIDQTDGPDRPA